MTDISFGFADENFLKFRKNTQILDEKLKQEISVLVNH